MPLHNIKQSVHAMPPYILCFWCGNVPVAVYGDLCETCQKIKDKQDQQNERELDRLERKPRNPRIWLQKG